MTKKIVLTILIFISVLVIMQNMVYGWSWGDELTSADTSWKGDASVMKVTKNVMGSAVAIIRTVATGMAIIMLTYVAIKYMTAAPNEKAEFKKSATAFIVGAIVLFATSGILTIISDFATTNTEITTETAIVSK